jgi:hypothetical protein
MKLMNKNPISTCHPQILEADGYADLSMWPEASARFHALPLEVRLQPGLHRLRLRILVGMEDFTGGVELAWTGPLEDLANREAAANYLLGFGKASGSHADEMASLFVACNIWPEGGLTPPPPLPPGFDVVTALPAA